MKIVHCVESYYPAIGGMQEVVKQLSERLAALGHEVTVATRTHPERNERKINGVRIREFNVSGNIVQGIHGEKEAYQNFLLTSDHHIITFFAAQQWATDLALPLLDKIGGKKVSVPTGYSGLYWPAFIEYFQNMKQWIRGYDMNVYLSNDYRDIDFARAQGVSKLCIIPNGAAADEFLEEDQIDVRRELGLPDDCFLVLHVGSFTGWKGQREALDMYLRSDLKNSVLLLLGNMVENFKIPYRKFPLLALRILMNRIFGKKKTIARAVPREFTVSAYRQANLFLFPSNIECSPIVLFECAAARLPFLSTDVGNAAEIAEWTKGGVILPTKKDREGFSHARIKESAEILNTLYQDSRLRKEMGEKAFRQWEEKFSWEKIAIRYEQLYQDLSSAP